MVSIKFLWPAGRSPENILNISLDAGAAAEQASHTFCTHSPLCMLLPSRLSVAWLFHREVGASSFLQNVRKFLPDYTASHPDDTFHYHGRLIILSLYLQSLPTATFQQSPHNN
jgi:hypothetical protein